MKNIFNKYKNRIYYLIASCIVLLIITTAVFISEISTGLWKKETKNIAEKKVNHADRTDHIALVTRYAISMDIYENKISEYEAELSELILYSQIVPFAHQEDVYPDDYNKLTYQFLKISNYLKTLLEKTPLAEYRIDKAGIYLDIAYYYELNNYYERAIEIYAKALAENKSRSRAADILLHQGFCFAIMNDYTAATDKYRRVINNYSDQDASVTAGILLKYLDEFSSEIIKITKKERDSAIKAEKLIQLMAYSEALAVLGKVKIKSGPSNKLKLNYLRSRCFEGLGENEKSIDAYEDIILSDSQSKFARSANRRLYIMGCFSPNGNEIMNLSVKNDRLFIRDENYLKLLNAPLVNKNDHFEKLFEKNELYEMTLTKFENENPLLRLSRCGIKNFIVRQYDKIIEILNNKVVSSRREKAAGIVIGELKGELTESGGTATFTIRLKSKPQGTVVIRFNSVNTKQPILNITSVKFSPSDWSKRRTVRVRSIKENVKDINKKCYIVFKPSLSPDKVYNGITLSKIQLTGLVKIQEKKPEITPESQNRVMILTTEGNTFKGIVKEETEDYIILQTIVGEVKIMKKLIIDRAQIN